MATLEAGLTRDEAFALLQEHNKDPFHIEHGETVEQTMRYFAREFDPENEEFWGIVGLLHDLDWEEHDDEPELHTIYAAPLIEAAGGSPELIRAIQSHTSDFNPELPKPELQMEKILFASEELTGLIGAAVVMRPSKSVMDFEVSLRGLKGLGRAWRGDRGGRSLVEMAAERSVALPFLRFFELAAHGAFLAADQKVGCQRHDGD